MVALAKDTASVSSSVGLATLVPMLLRRCQRCCQSFELLQFASVMSWSEECMIWYEIIWITWWVLRHTNEGIRMHWISVIHYILRIRLCETYLKLMRSLCMSLYVYVIYVLSLNASVLLCPPCRSQDVAALPWRRTKPFLNSAENTEHRRTYRRI